VVVLPFHAKNLLGIANRLGLVEMVRLRRLSAVT
jgi:hypothetical protein